MQNWKSEGLLNHDLGQEINNIYPGRNDKWNNIRPCHTCNGPHFMKDCDETTCLRCRPNFDDHAPLSKCPRKCHPNKHLGHNNFNNNNKGNRQNINQHTEPNIQLPVLTNKPDQMAELLETTRKMTKYFKRSLKHNSLYYNNTSNHQSNTSTSHSDKHKCKSCYQRNEVNEITTNNHT